MDGRQTTVAAELEDNDSSMAMKNLILLPIAVVALILLCGDRTTGIGRF